MKKILAATFAALLLAPLAQAEKADSLKQLDVDADDAHVDNVTQTVILTGNVIATRGTLILKADRAEIKETPEGYKTVTLFAGPGKVATFRQKRDGGPDLWAEGQGERIEYDERTEIAKLFSNAIIRQLEGPKVTQQMNGPFISYDSRKEVLLGHNDASGADVPGKGRVHMTFQPKRTAPAPAPAGKP